MKQREGYLFVDHQASPGLPEDVARASGYDPLLCKEGKQFEAATLTCAHCKITVIKSPLRTRERAHCMKCSGKYVCDVCGFRASQPDYSHTPYEKLVDVTVDLGNKGLVPDYNLLLLGNPTVGVLPVAKDMTTNG